MKIIMNLEGNFRSILRYIYNIILALFTLSLICKIYQERLLLQRTSPYWFICNSLFSPPQLNTIFKEVFY